MRAANLKRIRWLTDWFDELHRVDPALLEEIVMSSAPVRLFRQGVGVEADIVLEPVVRALSKGLLKDQPALPSLMRGFYRDFRVVTRRPGAATLAYDQLLAARQEWHALRRELLASKVEGAADFVAWFDRDVEELTAIAQKRGSLARRKQPKQVATTARTVGEAAPAVSRADARRLYDVFVNATADASPALFPALQQLGVFLRHNDPVWMRIAEAVNSIGVRNVDALAVKIQGILGEALALRHPWVSHLISEGAKRAQRLASKLGKEWQIVFVEAETYATKTSGRGLGQLYDSSIWIVRRGPGAKGKLLDAAPVWILEVKSGSIAEAPKQLGKDFVRELGDRVRLPVGNGAETDFKVNNLRELLEREKVDLTKAGVGDASTQRLLVAPRAPTDRSLARNIPRGVAVDFIPALMSKPQLNSSSRALAVALKKAAAAK